MLPTHEIPVFVDRLRLPPRNDADRTLDERQTVDILRKLL